MNEEKRMAGEYEITQSFHIGDKEVVLGVAKDNAEQPYLCAFYEHNDIIGKYSECMIGDDYVELVKLYASRIEQQCERLRETEKAVTVPRETITADMCSKISFDENIVDEVVVIRPDILRPEYRTADRQLCFVTGGNGAYANARGSACFCINLCTGENSRFERRDVMGKMNELPDWAKAREAEIRADRNKQMSSPDVAER